MKKMLPLLLLASSFAHAEVPEVRASKVTCADLKATVEQYGAAIVVKKILLFKDKTYVRHKVENCHGEYEYVRSYRFKTLDEKNCMVGESCEYDPPYTPPSDSGGSSGSTWDGGGSSYEPPSRDDRGPSYDPPSRGDRGSSYDPPSGGERGSRYCPSC